MRLELQAIGNSTELHLGANTGMAVALIKPQMDGIAVTSVWVLTVMVDVTNDAVLSGICSSRSNLRRSQHNATCFGVLLKMFARSSVADPVAAPLSALTL